MDSMETVEAGVYPRTELLSVADTVAREKGIDRDQVLEAMEQAIQKAGRSKYDLIGSHFQRMTCTAEGECRTTLAEHPYNRAETEGTLQMNIGIQMTDYGFGAMEMIGHRFITSDRFFVVTRRDVEELKKLFEDFVYLCFVMH